MRPRHALALIAGLLGGAACAPPPLPEPLFNVSAAPAHDHAPLATLERSECYTVCPVYKLTVYRDGTIEYTGTRNVKVTGKALGQITEAQVDKLEDLFLRYQYLQFKPNYRHSHITDMPSVSMSYTPAGGTAKTVTHDLGDEDAPVALHRIEHSIDKLVRIERWVGTDAEREQSH